MFRLLAHRNIRLLAAMVIMCALLFAPLLVQAQTTAGSGSCNPLNPLNFSVGDCLTHLMAWLVNKMLGLFGMLVWAAGVFLNYAVNFAVIKMGANVSGIPAINAAWGTVRDVANILFIFALLFIGIATILQIESYGAKKLLASLIIAALLINFSLFFTKVIIDASNKLATEFYSMMAIPQCTAQFGVCDSGLSDRFMSALKLQTIYDANAGTRMLPGVNTEAAALSFGKIFWIGIFGSIFLIITAFIFFAAALLIGIRFAVLIILMVLSPIGFAASVLPATAKFAGQWWDTLFKQAFFAPAYLLMTYLSLVIISSADFITKSGTAINYAGALSGDQGAEKTMALTLMNFLVVTVFMVASLIIATKLGAYGAKGMSDMGSNLRKWGQGVVGRNTVGRAGYDFGRLSELADERLKESRAGRIFRRVLPITQAGKAAGYGVGGLKYGSSKSRTAAVEGKEKEVEAGIRERRGNAPRLAAYIEGLSERERNHAYEKLSAPDRAAIDMQLHRRAGVVPTAPGIPLQPLSQSMRERLTVEEREKTENAQRDAIQSELARQHRATIENYVATPTVTPAQQGEFEEAMRRLPHNNARRLSHAARTNLDVIRGFSARHLRDLQAEGDLQPDEVLAIVGQATSPVGYSRQSEQHQFITTAANRAFWTP